MLTYQDFIEETNDGTQKVAEFVQKAINQHIASEDYRIAADAENYDQQKNTTVMNYARYLYTAGGKKTIDTDASTSRLCSNFFHRLNTQRCVYSLGNGVKFTKHNRKEIGEDGRETTIDETKEKLGSRFDTDLKRLAYKALIHKVAFGFYDEGRLYGFSLLEFAPLYDENNGKLRAGIRFWQLDTDKPMTAVLYTEANITILRKEKGKSLEIVGTKAYKTKTYKTDEGGIEDIVEESYSSFPIVPLYGNSTQQSTLVGMKGKIDAYDLVSSGFADDIQECAQIYWLISGAAGMDDADIRDFRRRLKFNKVAAPGDEQTVTPYTQEIPSQARKVFLDDIRASIYEDFGALDVHTVAAGATNDHIDAAYQPMDEEADDFEFQIIEFLQALLELQGIDDTPVFKRNRISNQTEQTQMVLSAADYLDDETILSKLPFISVDEISSILAKKDAESEARFEDAGDEINGGNPEDDLEE